MTSALLSGTAGLPGPAGPDTGSYEPGAVVDAVLRLLVAERVPVSISSVWRATESAQRLLSDLGVAPAPMSPNRAYWYGVSDTLVGGDEGSESAPGRVSGRAVPAGPDDTSNGVPCRPGLTGRELQVLLAVADGLSDHAIGRRLHVTEHTVKTHVRRLLRKLGVPCRAAAVTAGYERGLLGGTP